MRVVKHEADEEKDSFKVTLKGESAEILAGCLIEIELRMKGKADEIIEKFPRGAIFQMSLSPKA